jgi:fucose 4-O-acetylase-like acetyltransferase
MENRNRNIDGIKGFLVLLVVVGHVLQGRLDQSIGRYMIYGFHMPFFIALAGYLFPYSRSGGDSLSVFLGRYWVRLILPWVLAMVVYAAYLGAFGVKTPLWKGWIGYLSVPFYHLWFVPAYLFWSFLTWFMSVRGFSRLQVFLVGMVISLPFFYIKSVWMLELVGLMGQYSAGFLIHTLRPHYFLFFVLGLVLREEKLGTRSWIFWVSGSLLLGIYGGMFYFHAGITDGMRDGVWIFANVFLLIAIFRLMRADALPKSSVFEWIGQQSLGVYLWHVLPLLWLKDLIGTRDLMGFYGWVAVAELLFLGLMYGAWRYWRGLRFLMGSR